MLRTGSILTNLLFMRFFLSCSEEPKDEVKTLSTPAMI